MEELVELSPLFETEDGLERGEVVIEEALRSPEFRAYLKKQGRLALEFGFSDSGRFIGQMAATFQIERLRLRLDGGAGESVDVREVASRVTQAQAGNTNTPVVISADRNVKYEAVVKVMDTLQRAGVLRVGLSVKNGAA